MKKDLEALLRVIDGGDRAQRRRWFVNIVIAVAGDFGLVYWQLEALERQREQESYQYEALMFVLSILVWYFGNRALWTRTGRGAFSSRQAGAFARFSSRTEGGPPGAGIAATSGRRSDQRRWTR